MALVLVIEDEADLQQMLEYNLERAGHRVRIASRGLDAVRLAKTELPDLVLLDLMLPDLSGTEVCRQLRQSVENRNTPVIMITARGEEIDRVVGFEVGADDYVVKPFSMRELMLRVQAILRRGNEPVPTVHSAMVEHGVLRIDREAHRIWVEGVETILTALEFRLLTTLMERKSRVQSRAVLLSDVWNVSPDVTTRTVDTHVKRLREKLGIAGRYIETVRGAGYRFAETPDLSAIAADDSGDDFE